MKKLIYQFTILLCLPGMLSCSKEVEESALVESSISKSSLINEMHLLGIHSLEPVSTKTKSTFVIKGEKFNYSYEGKDKSINFTGYKVFTDKLREGVISLVKHL